MNKGELQRGSVIRYAYLWKRERGRDQIEGAKDRPAIVLALSVQVKTGGARVYVVAITHSPPTNETDAVELPKAIKRRLGLDDKPAWIVTTESNTFLWPGHDIRTIPGSGGAWFYGRIPNALMERVAASYVANAIKKRTTIIPRDEN